MARPSKYNWEAIKVAFESGFTKDEICKKFNVTKATLTNKINKDLWIVKSDVKNSDIKNHILSTSKAFSANSGFVYIVSIADTNNTIIYKIGFAKSPKKRINNLQVGNPFNIKIELCFYCDDMISAEKELHNKFVSNRLNGEWFNLTNIEIEEIKQFIIEVHCGKI